MKRKGALPPDGVKQWCAPKTHFTAAGVTGMIRPVADAAPTMPSQRHTPQTLTGRAGSPPKAASPSNLLQHFMKSTAATL
jgi:hypothetical protein